ncbi:MAG: hypothetical protein CMF12_09385 [Idiomarina sp.]|nr:hypothetical protein [Idiomarina sp.]
MTASVCTASTIFCSCILNLPLTCSVATGRVSEDLIIPFESTLTTTFFSGSTSANASHFSSSSVSSSSVSSSSSSSTSSSSSSSTPSSSKFSFKNE